MRVVIQRPEREVPCQSVFREILVMPPIRLPQCEPSINERQYRYFWLIELIEQLVEERGGDRLFDFGEECA